MLRVDSLALVQRSQRSAFTNVSSPVQLGGSESMLAARVCSSGPISLPCLSTSGKMNLYESIDKTSGICVPKRVLRARYARRCFDCCNHLGRVK